MTGESPLLLLLSVLVTLQLYLASHKLQAGIAMLQRVGGGRGGMGGDRCCERERESGKQESSAQAGNIASKVCLYVSPGLVIINKVTYNSNN